MAASVDTFDLGNIIQVDTTTRTEAPFMPPHLERAKAQDEDPVTYADERRLSNPEISSLTHKTAADRMMAQYQAIMAIDQSLLDTDPRYSRYKAFITLIDEEYRHEYNQDLAGIAQDENALQRFMEKLVQDDRYLLHAVKIAESQKAVLEATTGVHTYVTSEVEPKEFVPPERVLDPANDGQQDGRTIVRPLSSKDLGQPVKKRWFQLFNRSDRDRSSDTARKQHDEIQKKLKKEGQKKQYGIATIKFARDPFLNTNVSIQGRDLDEVQKAFLRNHRYLGLTAEKEQMSVAAQQEVVDAVGQIDQMRMNYYAALGHDLVDSRDFNMVHRRNPLTSPAREFVYNINHGSASIMLDPLGFDRWGNHSMEVSVGVNGSHNHLERQIWRIQKSLTESMKDRVEKQRPGETLDAIEGHISDLSAAPARNPDRIQVIEKEQVPKLTKIQESLKKKGDMEDQKAAMETQEQALQRRFGDRSGIINPATGADMTYAEALRSWESAEKAITTAQDHLQIQIGKRDAAQATLQTLKADEEKKQAEIHQVLAQISAINTAAGRRTSGITPAEQQQLDTLQLQLNGDPSQGIIGLGKEKQDLTDRIKQKINDIERYSNEVTSKQGDVEQKKRASADVQQLVTQPVYDKMRAWQTKRNELIRQRIDKEDEIRLYELEIGDSLKKDPNDPNSPEWTESEINQEIEKLNLEKELAGKPEPAVTRQLAAYRELQTRLHPDTLPTIYDRARQDAQAPQVQENIRNALLLYPDHPPAYLYTLQIMYGKAITTSQQRDQFQNAATMYTPEMFLAAMQQAGVTADSIYDRALKLPQLTSKVNGAFIKRSFDTMMADATAGRLGKRSEQEELALHAIEGIPASDFETEQVNRSQQVEHHIQGIQQNIPLHEVSHHLQRISGLALNPQQIRDFNQTFIDIYITTPQPALTTSKQRVLQHFSNKHPSLNAHDAQQIVNKLYGLYNRGNASQRIYDVALATNGGNLNESLQASGAMMIIADSQEQEAFEAMVQSGQSVMDIHGELTRLAPADRPAYYDSLQILVHNINSIGPGQNRQNLLNAIRDTFVLDKESVVSAAHMSRQEVLAELAHQMMVVDTAYEQSHMEQYIRKMQQRMYQYETVDDLARQLIKQEKLSPYNPDTVRFYKMIAIQIDKRKKKI